MHILIIGSKGFIGQHAVRHFSTQGHQVTGADIVHDYNSPNYFLIDSSNADFQALFSSQPFDACINCSGAANVPESLQKPARDYELNAHNVFHMLNALRRHQPNCRFINLSSAAVYGNPQQLPVDEAHPLRPVSPYGYHKRFAEEMIHEFHQHYQLPALSLRIFSAYGEGLQKQFFWDLHQKARQGDTVELWGTGKESRDYIYIQDIMQVLDVVLARARFTGEALNVANGREVTIAHAATTFLAQYKPGTSLRFKGQTRPGDPLNWQADIAQIQALGYQQQFSLQQGLKQYAQWLKEIFD